MSNNVVKLVILTCMLMLTSCNDKPRNNPFDSQTDLDPSDWAPSNLRVVVLTDLEIQIAWDQKEKQIVGFCIERQANGGPWVQAGEVATDVTHYTDMELTVGVDYTYRVYAFTASNQSDYSNAVGFASDIDGNIYKTVKIGNQVWMAENLKVTHYRNGDGILNTADAGQWISLSIGGYCNYNNEENNSTAYGRLYNQESVNDSRNLAFEGWHVPSEEEWQTLIDYLGGINIAGGKMKESGTTHWNSPNTGATNESGFTALPGGLRNRDGSFSDLGTNAVFWSSVVNKWQGNIPDLYHSNSGTGWWSPEGRPGLSVRCIRD